MIIPVNTAKQFAALPADYHLRKNMVTAETVISVFHTNLHSIFNGYYWHLHSLLFRLSMPPIRAAFLLVEKVCLFIK